MNKRTLLLACAALALAAAYLTFFVDWHKRAQIQIFWEKSRRSMISASQTPGIVFHLEKKYPLTSIEVVEAEDARTNKYPHALWRIVAAGAPVPVDSFAYGAAVPGMKPEISTATPEPLQPDTAYCLLVQAGRKLKGQVTFESPF
jgi:hypothetical protein